MITIISEKFKIRNFIDPMRGNEKVTAAAGKTQRVCTLYTLCNAYTTCMPMKGKSKTNYKIQQLLHKLKH